MSAHAPDAPDALDALADLLTDASAPADRLAACALVDTGGEVAPWLARVGHLVARGGALALVRAAYAEPPTTTMHEWAVRRIAAAPAGAPRLRSITSTRPRIGAARTFETGLSIVGGARFSPEGDRIFAFAWGELSGDLARRFGDTWGSFLLELSPATGELIKATRAGQFRDEDGAIALSPDGRLAAVRQHRSTAIIELATRRSLAVLKSCEGPAALQFYDAAHLLCLDSSTLELWHIPTATRVHHIDAVGFHDLAVTGGLAAVTGAGKWAAFARYALPSLELVELRPMDTGRAPSAIALAGDGQRIATGDWDHRVRLWAPGAAAADELGRHTGWVSAVRFADNDRLLISAGWDGQVIVWDVASRRRLATLSGHSGWLTALEVRGSLALSCASDGDIRLWDLDDLDGAFAPPPFSFPYGGGRKESAACARGDRFLFRVGSHALAFGLDGEPLGAVASDWQPGPDVAFGALSVQTGGEDAPRELQLVNAEGHILEIAPTSAEPLALAAIGDRLAVLEADGHVSFWQVCE